MDFTIFLRFRIAVFIQEVSVECLSREHESASCQRHDTKRKIYVDFVEHVFVGNRKAG